jgi:hypothetical protein
VTGSVLFGTEDFIVFIRRDDKNSRDLPAMRHLIVAGIFMEQVSETAAASFGEDPELTRAVNIYLFRKYAGEKLKTLGNQFGISDATASQVCKRLKIRIENDRKLRKKIENVEERIRMSHPKI